MSNFSWSYRAKPYLSKQLKINQTSIFDWESGRYNPTLEKLNGLLEYFKIDQSYFLGNRVLVKKILNKFQKIEKRTKRKINLHPSIEKQIILTKKGRKYIKSKRKRIGSQKAVAIVCNFNQSVISLWESGITSPTLSRFKNYLDTIEIKYNYFVNNKKFVKKISKPFITKMISKSADSRRKNIKQQKMMNNYKAYILGVLGPDDGHVGSDEIDLRVIDKDFAEKFSEYVGFNYGIKQQIKKIYSKNKNHNNTYRARIHSKNITNDLKGYKVPYKEKVWRVPSEIKNATKSQKAMYLRGVYDSQAHVSIKKYGIKTVILNIKGLRELKKMLEELGIISTLLKNDYSLNIYGHKNLKLYNIKVGFEIKRKRDSLNRLLENYKYKN